MTGKFINNDIPQVLMDFMETKLAERETLPAYISLTPKKQFFGYVQEIIFEYPGGDDAAYQTFGFSPVAGRYQVGVCYGEPILLPLSEEIA